MSRGVFFSKNHVFGQESKNIPGLVSFFKEKNEKHKRIATLFNELSEKYNCSYDQLLLAWILKHPSNIYPIVGTTNNKRLEIAVKAIKINLEIEDWFLILKASDGKKVP